jgi:hypothetical protein
MKKTSVCLAVFLAAVAVLTLVSAAAAAKVHIANIDVIGNSDIEELYVSHPLSDNWGNDLLGEYTLSVNEGIDVVVSGPTFDLRIVWDDGTEREFTGVQTSWGIITLANDDDFSIIHH